MSSWNSYPKIFNVGHARLRDFFNDALVYVQEKVDGSQFSFGKFDGEIRVRSKNREFDVHAPDSLFKAACDTVLALADQLHEGWTYRGEVLSKNKHNVLRYSRTPTGHIVLFDIAVGEEDYLPYTSVMNEALRLGLEVVPLLEVNLITDISQVEALLEKESFLGDVPIEGLVFKRVDPQFDNQTGKRLIAKHVSPAFREKHKTDWSTRHPKIGTVKDQLVVELHTTARWEKAVRHLADDGKLQGEPQDIGPLIQEVIRDILEEEGDYIKKRLFDHHIKDITRGVTRGLPEWYKQQLLEEQFDQ